ncbi:MAG TPA: GGDEF domain-containing protein [Candidatus Competibacter sp.]|nr:GGDEF domain-containing protein [Candidatus Competibacter sp.]
MHAELEQRLSFCGNLPSLPTIAIKIIELANDPNVHLNDVARVIAMDPALVTKLFRAANSPLYGLRRKATNLRQVLNLLGLQGTLALALGFSLIANSRGTRDTPLDTDQFWRRSLLAATACRILGERLAMKNLEDLFLAGLLHGIGIMALAIMMPDQYASLLADATDHPEVEMASLDCERLATLERERLETDHAQVGSWLLRRWGLPEHLCQAVLGSAYPSDADVSAQHRTLVECVALAVRLADIWIQPSYWQNSPQVVELARQWFGLDTDDYMEILEAVSTKFPEIAQLFQIEALDAAEVAGILEQAREVLTIRHARSWPATLGKRAPLEGEAQPVSASLPNSLPTTPISAPTRSDPDAVATPARDRQYAFDALTGLFNRQQFEEILQRELEHARNQNWPLSLALLDMDGCKRINEDYGKNIGDQVLSALGRLFGGNIRRHDIVARYGGDEFALLLPACGVKGAVHLLGRLLTLIREWKPVLEGGQILRLTVSVGLATFPDTALADCASAEQFLRAANHALRAAKDTGRDRLAVYGE